MHAWMYVLIKEFTFTTAKCSILHSILILDITGYSVYSTNAVRKTSGCFPWRHLSQLLAFSVKRSISLAETGLMRFLLLNKAAGET